MNFNFFILTGFILFALLQGAVATENSIDRKYVVQRHNIVSTEWNMNSPAQVGNGEFAFGMDITGLQTFVQFNTMSHWGWHEDPLPEGVKIEDFKGKIIETHGRPVRYPIQNEEQKELGKWLEGNPHRMNLGRLSFNILMSDGRPAQKEDLQNPKQLTDLWTGIITSYFEIEGIPVHVKTACHQEMDVIGVEVKSELLTKGRLSVQIEFPYASAVNFSKNVGIWNQPSKHHTGVSRKMNQVHFERVLDETRYYAALTWSGIAQFAKSEDDPHCFKLFTNENRLHFSCGFSSGAFKEEIPGAQACLEASARGWRDFWNTGAAIDLSGSTDPRWKELERRIVLSQYLMKVNEAGSLPPQESGLVNNGWYGRFHFEMIWWHGVHYALWDRWALFEKCLHVYPGFLKSSVQRASNQGYTGARWPKCTAYNEREWPHPIHATLIWQQPHPIYFAELDYRLHPTQATLEKWRDVVFETAAFMADYAFYEEDSDRYVLGPPLTVMSENTKIESTFNPAFELGYWRFGLQIAQEWKERLKLNREVKWDEVLNKLSALPQEDGLYVTYEGIDSMWTKFAFEHPGLIGTFGMLPGDGTDLQVLRNTFDKVESTWNFKHVWGWDFPMLAMAATRLNKPESALNFLLTDAPGFQFDDHGLSTGGPFPYFPSNGGLLAVVAMMAGGWDGAPDIPAPGFPKNGKWVVRAEGFKKIP